MFARHLMTKARHERKQQVTANAFRHVALKSTGMIHVGRRHDCAQQNGLPTAYLVAAVIAGKVSEMPSPKPLLQPHTNLMFLLKASSGAQQWCSASRTTQLHGDTWCKTDPVLRASPSESTDPFCPNSLTYIGAINKKLYTLETCCGCWVRTNSRAANCYRPRFSMTAKSALDAAQENSSQGFW